MNQDKPRFIITMAAHDGAGLMWDLKQTEGWPLLLDARCFGGILDALSHAKEVSAASGAFITVHIGSAEETVETVAHGEWLRRGKDQHGWDPLNIAAREENSVPAF